MRKTSGRRGQMNFEQSENQPVQAPGPVKYAVPWKPIDNWIGVVLLAIIQGGLLILTLLGRRIQLAQSGLLVVAQLIYLLPVILIFIWRNIPWAALGFGSFSWGTLSLGCGLLIFSYGIILLHNLILTFLGIDTQGVKISGLMEHLNTPVWFLLVGAILAPLVEEIFFRGFLFQGFRARYGWIGGMLLSSGIFAIAHLDPVTLIPTFILGNLLAYLYHRTNSVFPGAIVHTLINTSSLLYLYVITQYPNLIPS
jgi:membrane protease YdiL (CAAX protease family)